MKQTNKMLKSIWKEGIIICSLLFLFSCEVGAVDSCRLPISQFQIHHLSHLEVENDTLTAKSTQKPKKWVAIALTIVLGPFGGHRLYLGTDKKIPIIYGITLGGALILPIIDLIQLIVRRDLSRFQQNNQVFMWSGNEL